MRRDNTENGDLPGQDSFLDIVANIVGILILLVMVVGLRAAHQGASKGAAEDVAKASQSETSASSTDEAGATPEQLEDTVRQALATRRDLASKVRKAIATRDEAALRDAERTQLAEFVLSIEEEIEEHRQQISEEQRRDFDLQAKLGAAEHELETLTRERIALVSVDPQIEEVESLPTPLAATVSGEEVQLRLSGGHVQIIPWDALNDAAIREAKENLWRLQSRNSMTITVGPIDGFRVKYEVEKRTFRTREGTVTQIGSGSQILMPEADVLGDPVDLALQPGSRLMSELNRLAGGRKPTVTIWTYPDSFDEFRNLKAELFKQGYSVAGRPLPAGDPIGRSPRGTKSSAQ
ncbi:MAG: hypothetical protein AAGF31_12550 [Planctomycetota bacterium]